MDCPELREDVRAFLRDHVDSYEKLELLLLLARNREAFWTSDAGAARLSLSPAAAEDALEDLRARQILEAREEGSRREFACRPASAALEETIARLVQAYDGQRLEVIRVMNANAIERIRNSAIHTFADAFLIRGRDKDG